MAQTNRKYSDERESVDFAFFLVFKDVYLYFTCADVGASISVPNTAPTGSIASGGRSGNEVASSRIPDRGGTF